ncbi:MAG: ABC transporter ATP-binding protein [Bdellovibrionales bacterium CG10_big_fil_rev_8_21_14_0_10_45_34]|nr:MAG: ABC transporter ATP-binding protein [Bdellovibrionales bacterium CG10_big_fil_rev_8_21_14_0_10_45_34]
MSQHEIIVEVKNVTRKYGSRTAVDRLDFIIRKGEFFGLLGPNGAGKTSLLKMLFGALRPNSGQILVLGLDAQRQSREVKKRIGVVTQEDWLDPDLSVIENLLIYARYFGIDENKAYPRARELLRFLQMEDRTDDIVESLSGGMKRRVSIARALIHTPQVLILDEPTTGLDPQARIWLWSRLEELKSEGLTILLTTHYMDEAERLCDRVAIMDRGEMKCIGHPAELISLYVGSEVLEFRCRPVEQDYLLMRVKDKYDFQSFPGHVRLFAKAGSEVKNALSILSAEDMRIRRANLEDVFIRITGYGLDDAT